MSAYILNTFISYQKHQMDERAYYQHFLESLSDIIPVGSVNISYDNLTHTYNNIIHTYTVNYDRSNCSSTTVIKKGRGEYMIKKFPKEEWDGLREHLDLLPSVMQFLEWIEDSSLSK